ncbi:UDP-N-acetylglucosamine transferase subunit [Monascus purpureus]|nr:UDP-N-acetylglucosamine transferase subunit [Monascus purpureus]
MAPWQLSLLSLLCWALALAIVTGIAATLVLARTLAASQRARVPKYRPRHSATHLLVVLGSGGHTAEMFSMLRRMPLDPSVYTYRTYVVSSGDNFSARKAVEFETGLQSKKARQDDLKLDEHLPASYAIVTVPRARRVHQSYLTAPFSTLQCFWACLLVLRGLHPDQGQRPVSLSSPYPDVILTNGPATAVCVVLAAKLLRFWYGFLSLFSCARKESSSEVKAPLTFQLRTIFVESWARVTTLSLSGKLLLPFVDRFLVQWPALEGKQAWRGMRKTEYVDTLLD